MTFEKRASSGPRTDLYRWRLQSTEGTHRWKHLDQLDSVKQPQSLAEKYFLGLPMVRALFKLPMLSANAVLHR